MEMKQHIGPVVCTDFHKSMGRRSEIWDFGKLERFCESFPLGLCEIGTVADCRRKKKLTLLDAMHAFSVPG